MDKEFDFALEKRLLKLDKRLHKQFTDVVFSMQFILKKYKMVFPNFTDHTIIHSLNVIEFCNKLIGPEINKLNADEIYVLLLGAYLHDSGMGISKEDYLEFSKQIDFQNYFDNHSPDDIPSIIRNFHHEFSALFVKKYSRFFEIPSKEHLFAVQQICRGHRKVDLEDLNEYPLDYKVPNGNTICLPYLSAIIRLADEIDVTAARNCAIDVNYETLTNEIDLIEFMKHDAVRSLDVTEKEFIVNVQTDDDKLFELLNTAVKKMQATLDQCRHVVNKRTEFTISQETISINKL